jgi:hypothetical protein
MIDELIARGDIQKMVLDSQRHVKVLGECAKSVWPAYEPDLTTDETGAFGFVNAVRIERQYKLRSLNQADALVVVVGPFNANASDEELRIHFVTEIAKRKKELEGAYNPLP